MERRKRTNPNAEKDRAMRALFLDDYRTGYSWGKDGKPLPDDWTAGQHAGYLAGKAEQRRLMRAREQRRNR